MGDHYRWEGVAGWVLGRTSGEASALARGLGIAVYKTPMQRVAGTLATIDGRLVISVRASLSSAYQAHAIAHEIGHWALRETGSDDSEAAADYVAAALLMPWGVYRARVLDVGHVWAQLAREFGVTETSAALRAGEVMAEPLAVVAPALVRVRGPLEWQWPSESTVRAWARNGAPGIVAARLSDARGRVVLSA